MKRVTVILSLIGVVYARPSFQHGTNTDVGIGGAVQGIPSSGSSFGHETTGAGAQANSASSSLGHGAGAALSSIAQSSTDSHGFGGQSAGATSSAQAAGAWGYAGNQAVPSGHGYGRNLGNFASASVQSTAGSNGGMSQAAGNYWGGGVHGLHNYYPSQAAAASASAHGYGSQSGAAAAAASASSHGYGSQPGSYGFGFGGHDVGSMSGYYGFSAPTAANMARAASAYHAYGSQSAGPSSGSAPHPGAHGFQVANSFSNSTSSGHRYAYNSEGPGQAEGHHAQSAQESGSVAGTYANAPSFQNSFLNASSFAKSYAYNTPGIPVQAVGGHAQGAQESGSVVAGPHSDVQGFRVANSFSNATSYGNSYGYNTAQTGLGGLAQTAGSHSQGHGSASEPAAGPRSNVQGFQVANSFSNATSYGHGYATNSAGPAQLAGPHAQSQAHTSGSLAGPHPNTHGFQIANSFSNATYFGHSYAYSSAQAAGSHAQPVAGSQVVGDGSIGSSHALSGAQADISSGNGNSQGTGSIPLSG